MIAEYDIATKPKAPRGNFICPYCGEIVIRRLSKVKNPNLVFCNNDCRAKYQEREKLKKELAMTDDEFLEEVKFCRKIIAYCYKGFLHKFNNVEWDEMKQIALITIWKNHTKANNGKGDKGNFYIEAINKSFFNLLTRREKFYQIDEWQASEKYNKHLEEVIKVYERKDKQATETSIAYNELLAENEQLKELLKDARNVLKMVDTYYGDYDSTKGFLIVERIDEVLGEK